MTHDFNLYGLSEEGGGDRSRLCFGAGEAKTGEGDLNCSGNGRSWMVAERETGGGGGKARGPRDSGGGVPVWAEEGRDREEREDREKDDEEDERSRPLEQRRYGDNDVLLDCVVDDAPPAPPDALVEDDGRRVVFASGMESAEKSSCSTFCTVVAENVEPVEKVPVIVDNVIEAVINNIVVQPLTSTGTPGMTYVGCTGQRRRWRTSSKKTKEINGTMWMAFLHSYRKPVITSRLLPQPHKIRNKSVPTPRMRSPV
uniref:Uncharacterized protein n=1 Tax=Pristionchus pacificus TaxID=54126 RepID=A0A2A6BCP7_PRIPA|eukprot:PDM63647.1 hypothetical protein PRIPAC_49620 [Pristionchus pacificus]